MNVAFHALVGGTSATIIAKKNSKSEDDTPALGYVFIGAAVNILAHGALDLIPHNYPFALIIDGIIACAIGGLFLLLCKPAYRPLTIVCIGSAVLPDLIDKIVLRKLLNSSSNLFFWHSPEIVNLFYKYYASIMGYLELTNYFIVASCLLILIFLRKSYFRRLGTQL